MATETERATTTAAGIRRKTYFAAMFVDTAGTGLWTPFSLIFFSRAQGLPVNQAGAALTAGGLAGLAIGLALGGAIDRYGPVRALLASNLLRAGAFFGYPAAHSVWPVAVLATLHLTGDRLFWTANAPFLRGIAADRGLDRLLATQNTLRIVGLGTGAAGASALAASAAGLRLVACLNAVSYLIAAALIVIAVGRARLSARPCRSAIRPPGGSAWGSVFRDRPYLLLCVVQLLFALGTASLVFILPLVCITPLGGPLWLPSAVVITSNVVIALSQRALVGMAERTSRRRAITAGAVALILACAALACGTLAGPVAIIGLVLGAAGLGALGQAICQPLLVAAANQAAPEATQGRYNAVFQLGFGLANVLSPAIFTALLTGGNAVLWASVAGLVLLALPGLRAASNRLPESCLR